MEDNTTPQVPQLEPLDPQQTAPNTEQLLITTKKSKKIPALLSLFAMLTILGLAGYWLLIRDTSPETVQTNEVSETIYLNELDKIELIELPERQAEGEVIFYAESIKRYVSIDANKDMTLSANIVKKESVTSLDYDRLYSELVTKYLGGFKKVDAFDAGGLQDSNSKYGRYEDGSSVCTLYLSWPGDNEGNIEQNTEYASGVGLFCGNFDDVQSKAEFMDPFYKAYYAAYEDSEDFENGYTTLLKIDDISTGDRQKYEKANGTVGCVIACGGAAATFAREKGGEWEFVLARQDTGPCSSYKTEVARNALADEQCGDGELGTVDMTTVAEYYNL